MHLLFIPRMEFSEATGQTAASLVENHARKPPSSALIANHASKPALFEVPFFNLRIRPQAAPDACNFLIASMGFRE
jgi:hypothetical protein